MFQTTVEAADNETLGTQANTNKKNQDTIGAVDGAGKIDRIDNDNKNVSIIQYQKICLTPKKNQILQKLIFLKQIFLSKSQKNFYPSIKSFYQRFNSSLF